MAVKKKATTPAQAVELIEDIIKPRSEAEILKSIDRMRREAAKMTRTFFRRFSAAAIGTIRSGSTLDAGAFTPPEWAPLKEATIRKKRRSEEGAFARHATSMFRFRGELKTFFASADVTTALGTPAVAFRAGVGREAVTVTQTDAGAKFWLSRGTSGGRRSMEAVMRKRIFRVSIDFFPLLNTTKDARADLENVNMPKSERIKLQNPRGPFRSALHPYAAWWTDNVAGPRIRKVIFG